VEREVLEASDEEVDDALRMAVQAQAGDRQLGDKQLQRQLKRARARGLDEALRDDIAMRKAVDLLVENAKPIPVEQANARDKLWTPGKEKEPGTQEIWTPGS